MTKVTVYVTEYCPYCDAAKALLEDRGIPYESIDVTEPEKKHALKQRTGWRTVPQIFIEEKLIGGYQELAALDRSGDLQRWLGLAS